MLHKFTIPFKLVVGEGGKLRRKHVTKTCSSPSMAVGLGILVQVSSHDSKTVLKPAAFRLSCQPMISRAQEQSCYLKSCFLCNKNLSHGLDIYMYRGDQGFCSVECRNRQIALDETRELDLCTKKTVAAYRRCSGVSETGVLLDDLRARNKHVSTQKARAIFT